MADIFGQLIHAQLEQLASDPGTNYDTRIWWNTTATQIMFDDGTNQYALLRNDGKMLLGNSGTAAENVRLHRGAAEVLQLVTGDDTTSDGTLSTSLAQISSRAENYTDAGKPAAGNAGRQIWLTDLKKAQLDDGTYWIDVGSGSGSGGANYITNGSDPNDTTGWVESATGTFDIARNTTTPLRDDADFSFAKAASDESSEYIAFDFDIDPADVPSSMTISADIDASDANYADGDLSFKLYDLDKSAYIEHAGFEINAGKGTYKAYVQTDATSTNYELRCVVESTNATAYTVYMTNIKFGPSVRTYGSPDVYLGELTTTGTWTTNTTYTGNYWRRGDKLVGEVYVSLSGAPNAVSLTLDLPSGHSIDTSKLPTTSTAKTITANVTILDSGAVIYMGTARYVDSNTISFHSTASSGSYAASSNLSATVPHTFASGDAVSVIYEVPISGWSSSVRLSDVDSGRVVAFRANRDTSAQAISSTAQTTIEFNSTSYDTHGTWSSGSYSYIIPESGYYSVSSSALLQSITNSELFVIRVKKDGAVFASAIHETSAGNTLTAKAAGSEYFEKGAAILVTIDSTADASYSVVNDSSTCLIVEKIQGPSAIGAIEITAAKAIISSATNNGSTKLVWASGDVSFDTHAIMDATTDKCVIQTAGKYKISAFSEVPSGASWATLQYKLDAGSSVNLTGLEQGAVTISTYGEDTLDLVSGQEIEFYTNSGASIAFANIRLCIERIGGV